MHSPEASPASQAKTGSDVKSPSSRRRAQEDDTAEEQQQLLQLKLLVLEMGSRIKRLEAGARNAQPMQRRSRDGLEHPRGRDRSTSPQPRRTIGSPERNGAASSSGDRPMLDSLDLARASLRSAAVNGGRTDPNTNPSVYACAPSGSREVPGNSVARRPSAADERDPYDDMWSAAKFDQRRIFDQDLLKSIYDKPYQQATQQAALVGSGLVGLLSMPFGPIGMAAGGMFGAFCGGVIGVCADQRKRQRKLHESDLEMKRLKSLCRWAAERYQEDDEVLKLIEMVTLEFKPLADIAAGSKSARKQLRLLDQWIAQKNVTRQLWVYMDNLLQQWQDLTRGDFLRSMLVFQTLTTMYNFSSNRVLDGQEMQFVQRMERLLEHSSVKSVMAHAQLYPTHGETRVMECMVYADHERVLQRTRKKSKDEMTPRSKSGEDDTHSNRDLENGGDSDPELLEHDPIAKAPSTQAESVDQIRSPGPAGRVLKKPFFKDWDDFMEFDVNIKHKMPITQSEFNLLLDKDSETLQGWDVCVERKEIKVAKIQSGVGGITLRAWATVPGVDLHVAFYLFHNFQERVKWDKVFAHMEIVEDDMAGSDILYSLMRVPTVTSRDFLQYRRASVREDGSILLVLRSAEHPKMPEDKRYIRAESYISGYVLRQSFGSDGKPVLNIFLMSSSDVKGLIPKWIISYIAPKKPSEWVETLRKACLDYQEGNPNYKSQLEAYASRFRGESPFDYEPVEEGPGEPVPERRNRASRQGEDAAPRRSRNTECSSSAAAEGRGTSKPVASDASLKATQATLAQGEHLSL
mmetsp:Transcript_88674/g.228694  ORF Transcript_88674/g.228694 Transcript_88674/m.228694 type:complete len:802 (+) Transcript_88674:72-2477(+)